MLTLPPRSCSSPSFLGGPGIGTPTSPSRCQRLRSPLKRKIHDEVQSRISAFSEIRRVIANSKRGRAVQKLAYSVHCVVLGESSSSFLLWSISEAVDCIFSPSFPPEGLAFPLLPFLVSPESCPPLSSLHTLPLAKVEGLAPPAPPASVL